MSLAHIAELSAPVSTLAGTPNSPCSGKSIGSVEPMVVTGWEPLDIGAIVLVDYAHATSDNCTTFYLFLQYLLLCFKDAQVDKNNADNDDKNNRQ
jgi:hypothetical protein